MLTIDEQLNEANARIAQFEIDATASAGLLSEAESRITGLTADLEAANANIAGLGSEIAALRERNTSLESAEQDIEARASSRAAEIIAATGTQEPAKLTPSGDTAKTATRAEFDAMSHEQRKTFFATGGKLND